MDPKPSSQWSGFRDNRSRLFGRAPDLRVLRVRVTHPGLTAVVGRPKQGKTWLLTELCRRLAKTNSALVGYTEARGPRDLLLDATVDLYCRWLESSSFRQQSAVAWDQQRGHLLDGISATVGDVFRRISEVAGQPVGSVGRLVEKTLSGLRTAGRDLRSGGISYPPLAYDQAKDLATLLHRVTGRPILLVLDAWEQATELEQERRTLDTILKHLEEWPPLHLLVSLRPDHPAYEYAEALRRANPCADVWRLPPMHLEGEWDSEGERLVRRVRQQFPFLDDDDEFRILDLAQGFPGVVDRWLSPALRGRLASLHDLETTAADAFRDHYKEFEEILPDLRVREPDAYAVAMKLALCSRLSGTDEWASLKAAILDGTSEGVVEQLQRREILEGDTTYPTYGHLTRHESARRFFLHSPPRR